MTMPKVAQKKLGGIGELHAARSKLPHQPALPPDVADSLGERLRAFYALLMNDPVPDPFIRILEAMDGTRRANNGR
jgi:hypothetical protein